MGKHEIKPWPWACLALGVVALGGTLSAGGCVAIADIGDIEFGTTGTGASSGGGTGAGGAAAGGGTGPTCSDNIQNGQETGVDCGGPDCPACDEDCTNGEDDNGNNLVDCADPFCDDYACVPETPAGWTGPVAFYQGTAGESLPDCDGAWTTPTPGGTGTLNAPAAQCSPCACDPPTGASCGLPDFLVWEVAGCSGNPDVAFTISAVDACDVFSGQDNLSVMASPVPAIGGSCDANGGLATLGDAVFSDRALVCEDTTVGAGCSEAHLVCARRPPAPFRSSVCVSRSGDVDCPIEHYTEKLLLYTSVDDTRGCTACACSDPSGISCDGITTGYTNQLCSQSAGAVPNDGASCVAMAGARAVKFTGPAGPDGGSCAASGGDPTGSAAPGGDTTVCCLP